MQVEDRQPGCAHPHKNSNKLQVLYLSFPLILWGEAQEELDRELAFAETWHNQEYVGGCREELS